MKEIQSSSGFKEVIRAALGNPADLVVESCQGGKLTAAYLISVTDQNAIRDYLNSLETIQREDAEMSLENVRNSLSGHGCFERRALPEVIDDLLLGRLAVQIEGFSVVLTFAAAGGAKRAPMDPMVERTVRGPRLSFTETLLDNIAFIRRGIRSPALRIESMRLGRETRTIVNMIYLENVADPGIVGEVRRRLKGIDIDGILDTGYLEQLISDNPRSIFPLTQATERPDKTVAGILEGRVGILADGSSHAIIVPTTINELYQSSEDYYINRFYGSFLRFFRICGNIIAVALPGLYVALVGVNPELLPTRFALTVAGSRMGVAIPLVIEVLLMEAIVEIFRESSLRLPSTVSQTLGVTVGVVLGIAAVGAGLISQATLVVVVITAIASFSGPNYSIGLAWRVLRYALIFAAALMGLYGLTLAGLAILAHAAMQNSFGVSYLSPWAPIRPGDLDDTVIRRSIRRQKRPSTYHPQDDYRYEGGMPDGDGKP